MPSVEQAAQLVWAAWYAAMCAQGRAVTAERATWADLPEQERALDRAIATTIAAAWGVPLSAPPRGVPTLPNPNVDVKTGQPVARPGGNS